MGGEALHHSVHLSVGDVLTTVANRYPKRVAIVDVDGRQTSYRELLDRGGRLANALLSAGLEPGDRVASWMEDSGAYVEVYVACALAGLVVCPLNARYTVHEARQIVEDSAPRAFVWSSTKDGDIESLVSDGLLPSDVLRIRHGGSGSTALDAMDWGALVASGPVRVDEFSSPDQLYVIGYTSGTTGKPKGALLTQRSVLAVMQQNADAYRLVAHSVIALTGSMSFVSVVPSHVLSHLAVAGTVVFLGRWDVPRLLQVVEEHRATFTYLPSPVLGEFAVAAASNPQKWLSLQSVLHSASKSSPDALKALVDVVGSRLVEGWGMTENSGGLITATTASDISASRLEPELLSTVGRPIPGYQVRAVYEELQIKGPGVVKGYWHNPDAAASAFSDGWFRTGDLGSVDDRGYVTLLERRTDLIVSGGMNVYPAEVEGVIAALPEIAECAVVGIPHPRWGQTVVAVVVPRSGSVIDADAVIARCREKLAGFKKPTKVFVVDALPRTISMKVSRTAVRDSLSGVGK